MSSSDYHEGGCHCGAIRYRIRGATNSMICHCKTCRSVSGAPVMAWIGVDSGDYEVLQGSPRYYRSSPLVERSFCANCGTQLTYKHDEDSDWIDVATATLEHPEDFPLDHRSWLSHNIPWVKFADDVPEYQKGANDDDPVG